MALQRAWSVALIGLAGHAIEVEADLATGLPGLSLVGLPDASLAEARDRVRAAVVNSGLTWPAKRITVGLSPADLPKSGSMFDLAIAAAILAADGVLPAAALGQRVLLGELGLDGRVRATRGVLPSVLAAVDAGFARVVVPLGNAAEAALVPGVVVEAVRDLTGLIALLQGRTKGEPLPTPAAAAADRDSQPDLADVLGQDEARLALEVAAAGGHHLLLLGPPGAGKTMLAERLPGLLPALSDADALAVTAVHSVAGLLRADAALVRRPPLRRPHHSATLPALVGGGGRVLRPGEVSAAHCGVLFLDEAPEFAAGILDALRQPLEAGFVDISRAAATARFPARVLLVLAANPCPCAPARDVDCVCTSVARRRYHARLSGALLDRVDVRQRVNPVRRMDLFGGVGPGEPSVVVAARVAQARAAAAERWRDQPFELNGAAPGALLRQGFTPAPKALRQASLQLDSGQLSARGFDRVVRISWTLADLAGRSVPDGQDMGRALALRSLQEAVPA